MDPYLNTTSSSSSPSLDDSSLQRSLQLVHDKPNDDSKHDIVVDLGAGYNSKSGDSRTMSKTQPHAQPNIQDMLCANRWKYTIFGLVRFRCNNRLIPTYSG